MAGGERAAESMAGSAQAGTRRTLVIAAVLLLCLAYALGTALLPAHSTALNTFATGGWVLSSLVAGLRCLRVAASQSSARTRFAWGCFGVGCLGWSAGIAWWGIEEFVLGHVTPVPSIGDVGYLSLAPLFALGMLYLHPAPPALTLKQVADLGIGLCASGLVLVLALYEPLRLALGTPLHAVVAVSFPVTRGAALLFSLVFLWQHVPDARRRVSQLIVIALGVLAALAALYANELLVGRFESGNWFDAGYVLAFGVVFWASYEEQWLGAAPLQAGPPRPIPKLDALVPMLGIGSVALAFAVFHGRWQPELRYAFTLGGVGIACFLGLRGFATQRLEQALCDDVRRHEQESRRLEAELLHAQKLQAIHSLSTSVAHEFRNLIQVMDGNLTLARRQLRQEDAAQSYLEQVDQCLWRANDVTTRLLGLSRRPDPGTRLVRCDEALVQMASLLRRLLPRNIEVDGPSGACDAAIRVEPGLLDQVLLNLALNARDAMKGTGGRLRFEQRIERKPHATTGQVRDWAVLVVEDTGSGIAHDVLPRIFEPFFTTKPQGQGTGIGLPMVKTFVDARSGFIEVHSRPGAGTRFELYLPLAAETATATTVNGAESPTA